ncbi:MAG TPA: HD domain-containing protein [Desulfomicrobiaceae bacterium]|nr:HD domain-containing protein [Desulfomicrobiaceae bacterium]
MKSRAGLVEGGIDFPEWFRGYVGRFVMVDPADQAHLDLKRDHSLRVLEEATRLVAAEKTAPRVAFLARVAALLHDVGRFEQYERFRTYKDADSVDHARSGCNVLRRERPLSVLPKRDRVAVMIAVLVHNRKDLPRMLKGLPAELARVVRDADKLDIIPVVLDNMEEGPRASPVVMLGLRQDPDAFSSVVLEQVLSGQLVNYEDMVFSNDFKLLLCSWAMGLNYGWTRGQFLERGYLDRIFATLPESGVFAELRGRLGKELRS